MHRVMWKRRLLGTLGIATLVTAVVILLIHRTPGEDEMVLPSGSVTIMEPYPIALVHGKGWLRIVHVQGSGWKLSTWADTDTVALP